MKVLMLGWEFPPFFAGGVGIVCYELTRTLMENYKDINITYLMPYGDEKEKERNGIKLLFANNFLSKIKTNIPGSEKIDFKKVGSMIYCYDTPATYEEKISKLVKNNSKGNIKVTVKSIKEIYGANLIEEVYLYAQRVLALCADGDFDVIHAHDWTTFPAAILLKEITGKPVILHTHITEYNKTGGNGGHSEVLKIEKQGFENANVVITVSNQIKDMVIEKYGIDSNKVITVHNGGVSDIIKSLKQTYNIGKKDKIILYAGRVTLQKGPEYFIKAAKKVLEYEPNTKFIIAGSGDQLTKCIELANELGISKNILFHGFYSREEANLFFSMADVFVMPSVLEPFGIVPLEAMAKGTPTIITNQSGISEVLKNTFKIDFWDTDEMAHKILALIKYEPLHTHMSESGYDEVDKFNWNVPTEKIVNIYRSLV